MLLLCSLSLAAGCAPPGPRGPAPAPAPTPDVVVPVPVEVEVYDEDLVARVVDAFVTSGIADYQIRAKDYAALYRASANAIEVDKRFVTVQYVVEQLVGARELMNLIQGMVPKLSGIAEEEINKIPVGDLTDEKRTQFVTLLRNLSEGCRRAASK